MYGIKKRKSDQVEPSPPILGRRVTGQPPRKGLYIRNGRKVIR